MNKFLSIISLMLFVSCFDTQAQQLAFPGAEGFGKYATGGRGGKVYKVTNLNDSGSGSFREAFNAYPGEPLTVVFEVGGTIELLSQIKVNRSNITIAGQTAPGDGICFKGHSLIFNGAKIGGNHNNIIVRYIRSRPGSTLSSGVYGFDLENVDNVIVDHCSFSWANEECAAMYDMKDITVQYCVISEGLYNAGHLKGNRGYGGVWGGQYASFHHNLFAHLNARSTRFNGARAHDVEALIDYRNNVIYNAGSRNAAAGGAVNIENAFSRINLVNNYYKPGPATPSDYLFIEADYEPEAKGIGEFHVSGNIMHGNAAKTNDNWSAVSFTKIPSESLSIAKVSTPFAVTVPIPVQSAADAYTDVLKNAGAILPVRDAVDKRIVSETVTGTASVIGTTSGKWGIIDSPNEVGGWPVYNSVAAPLDSDGDGIPDTWEDINGLDKNNAIDGNQLNGEGYTMLEVYLNSITASSSTAFELMGFAVTLKAAASTSVDLNWTISNDLAVQTIEVERSADGMAFTSLTSISSKQNSALSEYIYTDNHVLNDLSYYRLKMIDAGNQVTYSEVKQINNPIAHAYWTEPFSEAFPGSVANPAVESAFSSSTGGWGFYAAHKQTKDYSGTGTQWTDGQNPSVKMLNYSSGNITSYGLTTQAYLISPVFNQGISKVTFNEINRSTIPAGKIKIYTSTDGGQSWSSTPLTNLAKLSQFELMTIEIASPNVNRLKIVNDNGTDLNIDNITIYAPIGVTLPLELISFTASLERNLSNRTVLTWKTANEINTQRFEIERSLDGKVFNVIGNVISKNTNGVHSYSFKDETPAVGVNYYRLKQIDIDGKYTYSEVQFINNNSSAIALKVYPNPSAKDITIMHPVAEKASFIISDISGKERAVVNVQEGAISTPVNIEWLSSGIYLLHFKNGSDVSTIKIVKE
ncbi:hypothetical protein Pedsa_0462 [Pseudopedobacter saltans DSM 12145]|uniref:Secretion system C-terminal sorting domain-containing protein n=1 Tax=Pseudopedobacter saltans (strain ATCC 51119 / DSM 12145 / JCM 21818 / CCUG 39354 / LMG 10337 / NBRC 100064 / NCIMB 13643) TaxID=762903 RepID=F0S5X3_PSESL|nr:T9SS type A sorting domain-containing protein [Pseudopedobacter saltans]ADY51044.1 hypothetical protein Pedsa_0462 [Pseudopedobacter saltans DSM 12145]